MLSLLQLARMIRILRQAKALPVNGMHRRSARIEVSKHAWKQGSTQSAAADAAYCLIEAFCWECTAPPAAAAAEERDEGGPRTLQWLQADKTRAEQSRQEHSSRPCTIALALQLYDLI